MFELPLAQDGVQSLPSRYKGSHYNHFVKLEDGNRLAYNALTNAMAQMTPEAWGRYQAIRKGASIDLENPVDQSLIEGKYILPESYDEIAYLRNEHLKARYQTSSWGLTICPTIYCNFGCDYCFEVHKPGKMKPEVQDALVNILAHRAPQLDNFDVTWYGGEPTTAWDVVQVLSKRFADVCEQNSVQYSAGMISNAYLLDAKKVAELPDLGINFVQITLDGNAEYHDKRRALLSGKGTFDRIVKNLENFLESPVEASIRVNVDDRNQAGVHALIDRLADIGLAGQPNISIYFAPVNVTTEPSHGVVSFCFTRKDFAKLEPEYYEHAVQVGLAAMPYPTLGIGSCVAAKPDGYVVEPDGTLQKCWDTVGQAQYAVGHLLQPERNPLHEIEYARWMAWDAFDEKGACSSCSWLASCMGGCPLKVVHPEASPDGEIHLECTTFKYNSKTMLPMFADWVAQGNDLPSAGKSCES